MNKNTLEKRNNNKRKRIINQCAAVYQFIEGLQKKNVYIYGNGLYGCIFQELLETSGINVKGFIVSNGQPLTGGIMYFTDVLNSRVLEGESNVLLIGVSKKVQQEIMPEIIKSGLVNYVIPSERVFSALTL